MKHFSMILFLLTAAAHAADFEVVGTYGERVDSFARFSHYVFLDQGYSLRVLDIADPANPKEIFRRHFDQNIDAIAIKFPALYLGFNEDCLQVFDITNPSRPVLCGKLDTGNRAKCLEQAGDFLVYETWDGKHCKLWVYDTTDPRNPEEKLRYRYAAGVSLPFAVFATNGSRLFYCVPKRGEDPFYDADDNHAHHSTKLTVMDITTSATTLGKFNEESETTGGENEVKAEIREGKLMMIDDDGASITLMAVSKSDTIWAYQNELSALQPGPPAKPDRITIELASGSLRILENENGTTPTLRCVYGEDDWAEQFKLAGKRGYLTHESNKTEVLDVSAPARIRRIGTSKLNGEIRAIDDNRVFVSGGGDSWFVYDFTDPTSPTLISKFECPDGRMSIQGNRACVAAYKHGLDIFDISNPKTIRKLGEYPAEDATDLVTSGSLVYLMAKSLRVIDASDASKPVRISDTEIRFENSDDRDLDDDSVQLKKLGPAVYVIEKGGDRHVRYSIRVVDVRDPAQPRLMPKQIDIDQPSEGDTGSASIAAAEKAAGSPYAGWYLAVPTHLTVEHGGWVHYGIDQVTMLDLSDPLSPVEVFRTWAVQSCELNSPVMYKNTIYLPTGPGGLMVVRAK